MRNNSTWTLSAPSPTPWARDAWNVGLVLLVILGTLACMFGVPVVYLIVAYLAAHVDLRSNDQLLVAQTLSYFPQALFLVAVLPRVARTSLYDLGFRAPTGRDILTALAGVVAMSVVVTIVGSAIVALTKTHPTEAAIAILQQLKTPGEKTLYALVAIVLAPIVEELTFRVFIFNALTRYLPLSLAAFVSGAAFGVVHAQPGPGYATELLTLSIPLCFGGMVLAYVYASTRCYWANVLTHGTFNAITVIGVLFFHAK